MEPTPATQRHSTDHATATRSMRAVVLEHEGGPELLSVRDVPVPDPGRGEMRIRLSYAALNHLDVWIRRGLPSVPRPRIMGADGAGVVDALGTGAAGPPVGTRVLLDPSVTCGDCRYCVGGDTALCNRFSVLGEHRDGTHAGYVVVPVANAHTVPGQLDDAHAAALPLAFATAWRMIVARARARPGERMLVWGASAGVGAAALQLATAMGIETIATTRSAAKLDALRELGATHVIDTSAHDVVEQVAQFTSGEGVEVVFDHLGDIAYKPSIIAMARGGRLVTCGATTGAQPKAMLTRIFWKQLSVLGSTMASKADMAAMLRFVEQQRIVPRVDREFALDDIVEAHRYLEGAHQVGKVVLRVMPA